MTIAALAEDASLAYRMSWERHASQGRELPDWRVLGPSTQGAWMAAVYRVTQLCGVVIDSPPGEDEPC